jgi:hypothetical protein
MAVQLALFVSVVAEGAQVAANKQPLLLDREQEITIAVSSWAGVCREQSWGLASRNQGT